MSNAKLLVEKTTTEYTSIRMLSLNRVLDVTKPLSDYPGIHLSPIYINVKLF